MSLRLLAIAASLLLALSAAYSKRQALQDWWSPPAQHQPPALQFDNGSAKSAGQGSKEGAPSSSSALAPGALRKCVKGQQVSYTNVECPPGHQEKPVAGQAVTVLPAPPKATASAPAQPRSGAAALRGALDVSTDTGLRDRMMDRAIDGKK